jgi:hypothetical protein
MYGMSTWQISHGGLGLKIDAYTHVDLFQLKIHY